MKLNKPLGSAAAEVPVKNLNPNLAASRLNEIMRCFFHSSVHDTLIHIEQPEKYPTPYGGRLVWKLPGENVLIAHLKDKEKIRHKKRWSQVSHDDVVKWKHFPRYWPFVRGIHRSPVNSPHKGQWRWPLMYFDIFFDLRPNKRLQWTNHRDAV